VGIGRFLNTWSDGNLGVRFFFSLSGFLITWLMLDEESRGQVRLKNFYIRRSIRIWPVYFTYVAVMLALQLFHVRSQTPDAWRGVLTFTRNFHDMSPADDWGTNHLWSLSIEEQFYLFWPVIFCLFKCRVWFLLSAIGFSIGFRTIELFGLYDRHHSHFLFQSDSTFNYLDCLAWGCLAAIALFRNHSKLEAFGKKYSTVIFAVSFSAIIIPYLAGFGKGIQAIGFVCLMLHSVLQPSWGIYPALNWKPMERIGILSFSIYIWQEIVCWLWPTALAPIWPVWIFVAVGLAYPSYELLEKPFLKLRSKFRY
jgi:peptidoglycan/LPS O-acetylase OafA/YrhL